MPLSSSRIIAGRGSDAFAIDTVNTSGLTLHLSGGVVITNGVFSGVLNATLALTPSAVNFVEVDDAGTVSVNTTAFTASRAFLYEITTSATHITAVSDWRFSPNVESITAQAGGTIALDATATGANDVLSAVAVDRNLVGVVTVTTALADGDGAQPTYTVGEEGGSATKFMAAASLTGGAVGLAIPFAGTLTAGKRLQVYATAGTGSTETGAVSVTAVAV